MTTELKVLPLSVEFSPVQIVDGEAKAVTGTYDRRINPCAPAPPVEFPKPVDGWRPKVQMDGFLDWVKVEND